MIRSVIVGMVLMISSRWDSIGPAPFLNMKISCTLKIVDRFDSKADLIMKIVDFRPVLVKFSARKANWLENGMV